MCCCLLLRLPCCGTAELPLVYLAGVNLFKGLLPCGLREPFRVTIWEHVASGKIGTDTCPGFSFLDLPTRLSDEGE